MKNRKKSLAKHPCERIWRNDGVQQKCCTLAPLSPIARISWLCSCNSLTVSLTADLFVGAHKLILSLHGPCSSFSTNQIAATSFLCLYLRWLICCLKDALGGKSCSPVTFSTKSCCARPTNPPPPPTETPTTERHEHIPLGVCDGPKAKGGRNTAILPP